MPSESDIMNKETLSNDNTKLIKQFKQEIKQLRYPALLKNSNISIRSV